MDSNRHGDWPLECKVYIGDLGEDATRRELEEAFDKFGRVRNVWIAKRPPGGQTIKSFEINTSTGFAFVLMDDPRDAEDATRELDGSRMCGRRVKVRLDQIQPISPPLGSTFYPIFSLLGYLDRLATLSADRRSYQERFLKIFVLKFSCLDLPASLPFPSLHSTPTHIKLVCPRQALKESLPSKMPSQGPLCPASQAKLPNKQQVRLCRSLPKIRVLFKPLHSAPPLHLCPLRCR